LQIEKIQLDFRSNQINSLIQYLEKDVESQNINLSEKYKVILDQKLKETLNQIQVESAPPNFLFYRKQREYLNQLGSKIRKKISAMELFDLSDWNDLIEYEFNDEQFTCLDSQELISYDFSPLLSEHLATVPKIQKKQKGNQSTFMKDLQICSEQVFSLASLCTIFNNRISSNISFCPDHQITPLQIKDDHSLIQKFFQEMRELQQKLESTVSLNDFHQNLINQAKIFVSSAENQFTHSIKILKIPTQSKYLNELSQTIQNTQSNIQSILQPQSFAQIISSYKSILELQPLYHDTFFQKEEIHFEEEEKMDLSELQSIPQMDLSQYEKFQQLIKSKLPESFSSVFDQSHFPIEIPSFDSIEEIMIPDDESDDFNSNMDELTFLTRSLTSIQIPPNPKILSLQNEE
jgi:hypothetical protein